MRLFSVTACLTVSRSSEDSSPNTIRPLQSTTRTPSLVRVVTLSCIRTPLRRVATFRSNYGAATPSTDPPAYRLRCGFSKRGCARSNRTPTLLLPPIRGCAYQVHPAEALRHRAAHRGNCECRTSVPVDPWRIAGASEFPTDRVYRPEPDRARRCTGSLRSGHWVRPWQCSDESRP